MAEERLVAGKYIKVDKQTHAALQSRISPEAPSLNNVIRVALGLEPTGTKRGPLPGHGGRPRKKSA